jgi:hypothetical protein
VEGALDLFSFNFPIPGRLPFFYRIFWGEEKMIGSRAFAFSHYFCFVSIV